MKAMNAMIGPAWSAVTRPATGGLRRPRGVVAVAGGTALIALVAILAATSAAEVIDLTPARMAILADAGRSCPALTPARLAGQVMAATGFHTDSTGGVGGLTAAEWAAWRPSSDDAPSDDRASLRALAHLTCDLVGHLRVDGFAGDLWPLAVAAVTSSLGDVEQAKGVPAAVADSVQRAQAYANSYASMFPESPTDSVTVPVGTTAGPTPTGSSPAEAAPTRTPTPMTAPPSTSTRPALTLAFPSFPDASGLRLVGAAHPTQGRIDLTSGWQSAGSAWATQPIDTASSFQSTFTGFMPFQLDGMAFVLQSRSADAIGGLGAGNGYGSQPNGDQSRMIRPSVAVEVDTIDDFFDPPNVDTHVAVTMDGDITRHYAWGDPGFSMANGQPFTVWVDYDAASHRLDVYTSPGTSRPVNPLFSYPVDLKAHLGGRAWVGFTGGTGPVGLSEARESVLSWRLTSN